MTRKQDKCDIHILLSDDARSGHLGSRAQGSWSWVVSRLFLCTSLETETNIIMSFSSLVVKAVEPIRSSLGCWCHCLKMSHILASNRNTPPQSFQNKTGSAAYWKSSGVVWTEKETKQKRRVLKRKSESLTNMRHTESYKTRKQEMTRFDRIRN